LEVAVSYDDKGVTELFPPRIRAVWADIEPTGGEYDAVPYLQEQVPSVE